MTNTDAIILLIGILICVIEFLRGFCKSGTDFLLGYGALYGATSLTPAASNAFAAHGLPNMVEPTVFCLLCIVGAVLTVLIGRFISEQIYFELGMVDRVFAAAASVGLAMVVGHAIVQQSWMASVQSGQTHGIFANDDMAKQLYGFEDYHTYVDNFTGNSAYARTMP